jgi:hypothetical protein
MTEALKNDRVQDLKDRFPGTKNLGIKIAAYRHMQLKFAAAMEHMSQSEMIEKMIADYVPPDMRPDDIDKQRDEQAFLKRLKAEGWVIEPPKGEASK